MNTETPGHTPQENVTPPPAAVESAPAPVTIPAPAPRKRRFLVIGLIAGLCVLFFAGRAFIHSLRTISTDDAYVNSYVTFIAPRVIGQVASVRVEDNNRVKKGDVLVELDPEPYQVNVAIKQSALDAAETNLVAAQATTRGMVAQARSDRFKLIHAIEDVDSQSAIIRQRVATWEQSKVSLKLAQQEFDRAKELVPKNALSTEEYDKRREALDLANAGVTQALENVYQARVNLGLPAEPAAGGSLTDLPPDLDQTFSSVRQALAELLKSAAQLGIIPSSFDLKPKEMIEEFYKRDPSGNIDRIYADVIKNAPGVKQAEAAVQQAQRDLDRAKLELKYCTIVSEIDGVVTRRNVNPGNYVQVGQSLMAVRSLKDIWVDANFKETQLQYLRIGQHVDLETDMYGSHQKLEGRISGFTMGTGSTLALLPAQNATGNFVKVVQRLPVRIDLINYNPDELPLFVGISIEPVVDIKSEPSGPNAGKFLQAAVAESVAQNKP